MKKFIKRLSCFIMLITCFGACFALTGCSETDKEEILSGVQNTTNTIAVEYSSDLAVVLLSDAINKSSSSSKIEISGDYYWYNNGFRGATSHMTIYEKFEDEKVTSCIKGTTKVSGGDDITTETWCIFKEGKYYCLFTETNQYFEVGTTLAGIPLNANDMFSSMMAHTYNADTSISGKYLDGTFQVAMINQANKSTVLITISKEGYITEISNLGLLGSTRTCENYSFKYNDNVEFPEGAPTSLEGYTLQITE